MSLKPSIAGSARNIIPEHLRQSNPNFVKFVEYYYRWMYESGTSKYLQDLIENRDIDNEDFIDSNVNGLMKLIPSNMAIVNKSLFVKHLKSFFRSKGTEESIKIFIQALLNDNVVVEWNEKKIFKASSAKYEKTAAVSLEGSISNIEGVQLIQYEPSYAHATVESFVSTFYNGKSLNFLELAPNSVLGVFEPGAQVRYLKNSVSRSAFEVKSYYDYVNYVDGSKTLTVTVNNESNVTTYVGLVVRQIGSSARAIVDSVLSKSKYGNSTFIQFKVSGLVGSFDNTSSLYLINSSFESNHYTKADWITATVSAGIKSVDIVSGGAGYEVGQPIRFIGGNGLAASARIDSVKGGPIEEVVVLSKGSGYEVGDMVVTNKMNAYGSGFSAIVSNIDGVDAAATPIMELDSFSIRSSITVPANTTVTIPGGSRDYRYDPVTLTTADGTNWTIVSRGRYYSLPDSFDVSPVMSTTEFILSESDEKLMTETGDILSMFGLSEITGMAFSLYWRIAEASLTAGGRSYQSCVVSTDNGIGQNAAFKVDVVNGALRQGALTVSTGGTGYTWAYAVISGPGEGALTSVTVSGGAVTAVNVTKSGRNYTVGSTVTIVGDGSGATVSNIALGNLKDGCIDSVLVTDSGQYYPDDMTLSTNEDALPATVINATLLPVTNEGKITSVSVVDGGEGYTSSVSIVTNTGQSLATFTNTISGSGKISAINIEHSGENYFDPSEITPLELTGPAGSGAILIPVIDNNGSFVRVEVLQAGTGYTNGGSVSISTAPGNINLLTENGYDLVQEDTSNLFTDTGTAVSAVLTCVSDNTIGAIRRVDISNPGLGYKLGTKVYVFGDGSGAILTPTVDTGITNVAVVSGGVGYNETTSISVTDAKGTGAVLKPVISNGSIVGVDIVNSGSGYWEPTIEVTCTAPGATGAVLMCQQNRGISNVTVSNGGTGYSSATLLVYGDGNNAKLNVKLDGSLGSVTSITKTSSGSKYTSLPTITFTDSSGYGGVSKVRILDSGSNYQKMPILGITPRYDISGNQLNTGAKLIALGKDVGAVRSVEILEPGAGYDEIPFVFFDQNMILTSNASFIPGEALTVERIPYKDTYFLVDDFNGRLLMDEGDLLINDDLNFTEVAEVVYMDHDRNLLRVRPYTDIFNIIPESDNGDLLITESGFEFITENSFGFSSGDVLIGTVSGSSATIRNMLNAGGVAVTGGNTFSNYKYQSNHGILNTLNSKLHDNARIQTHAYVLKTGYALSSYETFVKEMVHPAGYALYGDVMLDSFAVLESSSTVSNLDKLKIIINLLLSVLPTQNTQRVETYRWLENNKFYMDALSSSGNLTLYSAQESGLNREILLTEDGFYFNWQESETVFMATDPIGEFGDLTVEYVENHYGDKFTFNQCSESIIY